MTSGNATGGRRTATVTLPLVQQMSGANGRLTESTFPQVKVGLSGQGRGRTTDLPLFSP